MPIVYLDTETTGYQNNARIIDLCILDADLKPLFNSLINPGCSIPPAIANLTGISNYMVRKAPYWREVHAKVFSILTDATMVCHNAAFDLRMLDNHGISPAKSICTMREAKRVRPNLKSYKLADLARAFHIEVPDTGELHLASPEGARVLLIAGRALNEPIVQYGPFVMNTREQVEQALRDFRDGVLA